MKFKKAILILFVCFVFQMCCTVPVFSDGDSDNVQAAQSNILSDNSIMENVSAEAAILVETTTGTVIAEKNSNEQRPISHLAKLMTVLITAEKLESGKLSLDDSVTVSSNANSKNAPQIWLDVGEKISVEELLKSITIGNANDACTALAEKIGGTEEKYVQLMNKKAKTLGMSNTKFVDCTGTSENTVSTAFDLSILASELLKYQDLTPYFTTWIDNVRNNSVELVSTNRLIRTFNGCNGLKSCSSKDAGECIISTANRGDMSVCVVLLGSSNDDVKFSEAKIVMDYCFTDYEIYEPELKDEILDKIKINNGEKLEIAVKLDNLSNVLIPSGTYKQIYCQFEREESIDAPVKMNEKVGKVSFYNGDSLILESDIVVSEKVDKIKMPFAIKRILLNLLYI